MNSKSISPKSRQSSVLAKQKVEAEVAKARLQFASREAELLRRKTRLEADSMIKNADIETFLKNFKPVREFKTAEAEMQVLDENYVQSEIRSEVSESSGPKGFRLRSESLKI